MITDHQNTPGPRWLLLSSGCQWLTKVDNDSRNFYYSLARDGLSMNI